MNRFSPIESNVSGGKMRGFLFVFLLSIYGVLMGQDFFIPIEDFRSASLDGIRVNPFDGRRVSSVERSRSGGVQIKFEQTDCTLLMRSTSAFLKRYSGRMSAERYYIRYRVNSLDGKIVARFIGGGDYYSVLGVRRSGEWEKLVFQAGGFNAKGRHFASSETQDVQLQFHGSGDIEIAEIGIVFSGEAAGMDAIDMSGMSVQGCSPSEADKPIIDGNVNEKIWLSACRIDSLPVGGDRENETSIAILGFEDGVYCGAVCKKNDMSGLAVNVKNDSSEVWRDESIELSFDYACTGTSFVKIGYNSVGAVGLYGVSQDLAKKVVRKATVKSDRWELETFIPWELLGKGARTDLLAFNVTRNCYGKGDGVTRSGWKTTGWDDVRSFGRICLRPSGKNELLSVDLVRGSPGVFVAHNLNPRFKYNVLVSGPKGLISSVFERGGEGLSGLSFPVVFAVEEAGIYRIKMVATEGDVVVGVLQFERWEDTRAPVSALDADDFAFFPVPKFQKIDEGKFSFSRSVKCISFGDEADSVASDLKREMEEDFSVRLSSSGTAVMKIGLLSDPGIASEVDRLGIRGEVEKILYDGFLLSVECDKILISAHHPRGLVYASRLLIDAMKMSSGDFGPLGVRCFLVLDWPWQPNRIFSVIMHAFGHVNKYDVDFWCDALDRWPLRSRFNQFAFEFGSYYRWKYPGVPVSKAAWGAEEYARVIKHLAGRYAQVVPMIQSFGHMEWWLFGQENSLSGLREDGEPDVLCTGNHQTYDLLSALYEESLALSRIDPRSAPGILFALCDEVRWKTNYLPDGRRCRLCYGVPKNEIFRNHINKLSEMAMKNGVRLMIFSDMINEFHNGNNDHQCARVWRDISRDVALAHWSTVGFPAIEDFRRAGFDNWKILTGYQGDATGNDFLNGYGIYVCTYNWWLSENRAQAVSQAKYGPMAQMLIGNDAWSGISGDNDRDRLLDRYGKWLMRNWSRKRSSFANGATSPLDLTNVVNSSVVGGDWFEGGVDGDLSLVDLGSDRIAGIKTSFVSRGGRLSCVRATDEGVVIPVGGRASSLYFLHAANVSKAARPEYFSKANYRDDAKGQGIASYEVVYEGGDTRTVLISYGWNIMNWIGRAEDDYHALARYLPDSRWMCTGKTAVGRAKNWPDNIFLYQYEWQNPIPEKNIIEIKLKRATALADYALLALSAGGVR